MKDSDHKTIVVTGISSFIGAHLAIHFAACGHDVVGTVSGDVGTYESLRRSRAATATDAGVQLSTLDITDAQAVEDFIRTRRPSVWLHHAGWAKNYNRPDYDLARGEAVNVAPLRVIYPLLKECGCDGLIVTGSSAEYGESDAACTEDAPCRPETPYGQSKLAETIQAQQLAIEYELTTRVARVFIPYGPMDAPGKLLPSVIRSLQSSEPIDLSPCLQSRDFLYVRDLTRGYQALIEDLRRDELFDIFNICSGEARVLKNLLLELADRMGVDADLLQFGLRAMHQGEVPISYGSNSKAVSLLNWKPRPLGEGLDAYLHDACSANCPGINNTL